MLPSRTASRTASRKKSGIRGFAPSGSVSPGTRPCSSGVSPRQRRKGLGPDTSYIYATLSSILIEAEFSVRILVTAPEDVPVWM